MHGEGQVVHGYGLVKISSGEEFRQCDGNVIPRRTLSISEANSVNSKLQTGMKSLVLILQAM